MTTIVNGTTGVTFSDGSVQNTAAIGFRNRVINGNMVIDQRNAGASVTLPNGAAGYSFPVDRFGCSRASSATATGQQSTVAPAGFINSLLITNGTGVTVGSTEQGYVFQQIEGLNISDLGWGTANAQTVTISFWVRSSITGTHSGSLFNSAFNRSYPFTYTISAANTWEQKSVTVAGDTSGTWLTTNGRGITLCFNNGSGSTYLGTAGAWAAAGYYGATGSVALNSVTGSTFYITGVQLEKGTTASSFDFRSYGQELALCQRYYAKSYDTTVVPGTASSNGIAAVSATGSAVGAVIASFGFPVEMRAAPTMTYYSSISGSSGVWRDSGSGTDKAVGNYGNPGTRGAAVYGTVTWSAATGGAYGHWVASIEL